MPRAALYSFLAVTAFVVGLAIFLTQRQATEPGPPVAEVPESQPSVEEPAPEPPPGEVAGEPTPPPEDLPETAQLAGSVLLPDGEAAGEAVVTVYAESPLGEPAARAATGPDGRFEIAVADQARSWFVVRAHKPGYAGAAHTVPNPESSGDPPPHVEDFDPGGLELRLGEEAVVSGTLRHADGRPASGHELAAEQMIRTDGTANASAGLPLPGLDAVTVGEEGAFRLYGLREGGFAVSALKDGALVHSWELEAPAEGVELVLPEAGGTVRGHAFRLDDGLAVAGAEVALVPIPARRGATYASSPRPGERTPHITRAGESGRYTFEDVLPGRYRLQGRSADGELRVRWMEVDGEDERIPAYGTFRVPEDSSSVRADIHLYEGEHIRGRVVIDGKDVPVEGATVELVHTASGRDILEGPLDHTLPSYHDVTDGEGRFEFARVFHPGNVRLRVEAEGIGLLGTRDERRGRRFGGPVQDGELFVSAAYEDGTQREYTVYVTSEITISGTVMWADGRPAAEAEVRFHGRVGDSYSQRGLGDEWVRVDSRGAFTLPVAAYSTGTVTARSDSFKAVQSGFIEVENRPVEGVEVVVSELGRIAGRVTDREGRALPRAEVTLTSLIPIGGGTRRFSEEGTRQTDADGRFAFEGLAEGSYHLTAILEGYADSERRAVDLGAGEEKAGVTIALDRAETLRIRLVNTDGEPVHRATVYIQSGSMMIARVGEPAPSTDEDGRLVYTPVPPSPLSLSFHHGDYTTKSVRGIRAGEEEHQFVLRKEDERRLTVHVVDAETGEPVPELSVTAGYAHATSATRSVQVREGYFIDSDPPVERRLLYQVSSEGYATARLEFVVPRSPLEVEETLELTRGAPIFGRVVDGESGEPVPGAPVRLYGGHLNPWETRNLLSGMETDGAGLFRFEQVAEGQFTLEVEPADPYTQKREMLTHGGRESLDVGDVAVGAGGSIAVHLVRGEEPVPGQRVHLQIIGDTPAEGTTGADGVYTFEGLASGYYEVSSGTAGVGGIRLDDGENREVTIALGTATLELEVRHRGETGAPHGHHIRLRGESASDPVRWEPEQPAPGIHRWEDLAPGEYIMLFHPLGAASLQMNFTPSFTLAEGDERREVVDIPAGEISGRVVNTEGEPVSGASFTHRRLDQYDNWFDPQPISRGGGRFGQEFLLPGRYWVRAEHSDHGAGEVTIELEQDEVRGDVELVLRPEETGTLVSVALRYHDGAPIREGGLRIRAEDGRDYSPPGMARRDTDGVLVVEDLPAGEYDVQLRLSGYTHSDHSVTIVAGETAYIDDVLHEAGALSWQVAQEDGTPVAGAEVQLTALDPDNPAPSRSGRTNSSGRWRASGLHPGEYLAEATLPEGGTLADTFTIVAGETTTQTTTPESGYLEDKSIPLPVISPDLPRGPSMERHQRVGMPP